MGFTELIWGLFLLAALQPLLRQRLLETYRRRLISRIEREHGSRMILLVHRQESMTLLGFPLLRYIDLQDSEAIIHALQRTDPEVPVDLVLHTPGGLVLSASQIARAIKAHKGKVTVFVPHYAMSGGTLIALAADDIVMCPHSVLGPVDPQIGKYPAASLLQVIDRKPVAEIDDETLILADQAAKAIRQLEAIVAEVMAGTYEPPTVAHVAKLLTQGTWTHDYPITCEEAGRLGLHVRTDMPMEILELMTLYPQPVRRVPSVEVGDEPMRRSKPPAKPGAGN
ncbi:MAG: ATP-dependent Clp protease proteolytic subunit [Candidatus Binatia bacterium]